MLTFLFRASEQPTSSSVFIKNTFEVPSQFPEKDHQKQGIGGCKSFGHCVFGCTIKENARYGA